MAEDERHGTSGIGLRQGKPGFSFERAKHKTEKIFDVALGGSQAAEAEGISPAEAADRMAEDRMTSVGRLATIRL